jgi:tetratricopeptide (TPR) repeat protein
MANVVPKPGIEMRPSLNTDLEQAMRLHQDGNLAAARSVYEKLLAGDPRHAEALHLLGVIAAQTGRHDEAVQLITRAIDIKPRFPRAYFNLGNALRDNGQLAQAVAAYRTAVEFTPGLADAHFNLANILKEMNQLDEAIASYRAAITARPDFADACNNLGVTLADAGRPDEAIVWFTRAIDLKPDYSPAYLGLGAARQKKGDLNSAIADYRTAIQIDPGLADAHLNLGNALRDSKQPDLAVASYRAAIAVKSDFPEAANNLGVALTEMGQVDEAIVWLTKAAAIRPNYAQAYLGLGAAKEHKGLRDQAIADYRTAISIEPDLADAHYNLALSLLTQGAYDEGWEEHEWRWKTPAFEPRPEFPQPTWDGSNGLGTILLVAEQGFGDVIQFVRYARLVADRCRRVVLQCHPKLIPLLHDVKGLAGVIPTGAPLPDFDAHATMLSLPRIFGTRVDSIPATVPYLHPDPRRIAAWAAKIGRDDRLKVGLAWAGNPKHKNDRNRSMPLTALAPLATIPGTGFYSLQIGPAAQQATSPPPGMSLIDYTPDLHDFSDTAALIAHLDLVISVDTAVVHVAGAMARPVWTMLPFMSDWRWLTQRSESPWYPSMRLFRQAVIGDWPGVVRQVADALSQLAAEKATGK